MLGAHRTGVAGLVTVCLLAVVGCGSRSEEEAPPPARFDSPPSRVEPAEEFADGTAPNVVLILVDQLRADRLGMHGSPADLTPNLDAMARDGFYFRHARSAAPWTFPSVASLLTGLYPSAHGANRDKTSPAREGSHWINSLSPEITTLAEYAKRAGYQTGGFVTNPYLKPDGRLNQGFDHWEHDFVKTWASGPRNDHTEWWMESSYADSVNPRVLAWATDRVGAPAFLYVHYIDVHGPWELAPWRKSADFRARGFRDEYEIATAYIDRKIGELYRELDELYTGDLIFIVTSDHGNHLELEDFSSGYKKAKQSLHEFNLHVPLIFTGRRLPYHGNSPENVSLVDVLPTLLAVFAEQPDARLDGVSLWAHLRGEAVPRREIFAEVDDEWVSQSVIVDNLKRIHLEKPRPGNFEYDWRRDPHEISPPLRSVSRDQGERLLALEAAFLAMKTRSPGNEPVELDDRTVEQLRSLGYIE
jgi:arylsulfatase A-like enzyme